jgi:hypothetical protein
MDDASTARADAAVTMSRPKAADERVGANWAVGFAHEVEVTRRGREAPAARDGGVGLAWCRRRRSLSGRFREMTAQTRLRGRGEAVERSGRVV